MDKITRFERSEVRILDIRTMEYVDKQVDINYRIDIDHKILHEWALNHGYMKNEEEE